MSKLLISAGILFIVIIFGIMINILCYFIGLSDFTRGLILGVLSANIWALMAKRFLQ